MWWSGLRPDILESRINTEGYELMENREMDRAINVFKLNTLLFPESSNVWDSFGEYYYNTKEYDLSLKSYRKSVEIDPGNESGKQMINRIMMKKGETSSRKN